jgi:hypothetical protein
MIPGITLPSDWLRMALRAAPYFLIAALAIGLVLTRGKLATEKADSKALVAMYEARTAQAIADDLDHARAIQVKNDIIKQEKSVAIENQRTAARAAVDDYVRRMRDKANQGGGGKPGLSPAAIAAVVVDGGGEATVVPVPDLHICAENTVKAEGWRSWWAAVESGDR